MGRIEGPVKVGKIILICVALLAVGSWAWWFVDRPGMQVRHNTAGDAGATTAPYVASAGREPYHRRDCRWAAKIDPAHVVYYASREEAERDGKRACKVCRP